MSIQSFAELMKARASEINKIYRRKDAANLTTDELASTDAKAAAVNEAYEEKFEALRAQLLSMPLDALTLQLSAWGFEKPADLEKKPAIVDAYFEHERNK